MNRIGILLSMSLLFFACTKEKITEPPVVVIHYVDIVPDTLIVDSMQLDINNDNVSDVKFLITRVLQGVSPSGGPYYNYFARCISENPGVQISMGTETNPNQQEWDCLELNDSISNNLSWRDLFLLKGNVMGAGNVGIWDTNQQTGYLATRISQGGSTYFGWIRVNVSSNAAWDNRYQTTCYEFATSDTDQAIIEVGQII